MNFQYSHVEYFDIKMSNILRGYYPFNLDLTTMKLAD